MLLFPFHDSMTIGTHHITFFCFLLLVSQIPAASVGFFIEHDVSIMTESPLIWPEGSSCWGAACTDIPLVSA